MKVLIFDSGPLINLSMNGLLYVIENLKKTFQGKFIISDEVKYEVCERPLKVKRFQLGAMRIKKLIDSEILESPSSIGIRQEIIRKETKRLMELSNNSFNANEKSIKIVSSAEMSCMALSSELNKKGIENIIAIDERTARMLCEKPINIEKIMSKRLHKRVKINENKLDELKNIKLIRSSELIYVAHKKGLTNLKGSDALEALLYGTKFKGSSISFEEINVLKKL